MLVWEDDVRLPSTKTAQGPSRLVPSACEPTPRQVPGVTNAAKVAVGRWHHCVVHADQKVTCWGENAFGKLGVTSRRQLPDRLAALPDGRT